MYKVSEHTIFYQYNGLPVHYDPLELQFTELSVIHEKVLKIFGNKWVSENTIASFGKEEREAFNELVYYGLISTKEHNVSEDNNETKNSVPDIVAFRIVLTEKCNLCCAECFVTKNNNTLKTMSPEILDKTIDIILEYSRTRQTMIHFFGGEPTIKFDYIKHSVERLEKEALIKPIYSITTNATLINSEMAEFFCRHKFRVAISVDGNEKLHNLLRPGANIVGSYNLVKQNYELLSSMMKGQKPSIIITPHPKYLESLENCFNDIIKDFHPNKVTINIPFDYENLAWAIDGKKFATFLMHLTGICKKHNVEISSALSPILATIANRIPRSSPCSMFDDNIMVSIRTDGKMSFCAQKWHDNMVQKPISPEESIQISTPTTNQCKKCFARTICGGPCPAHNIISGHIIDKNKCLFMRSALPEIVNHLDWFEEKQEND